MLKNLIITSIKAGLTLSLILTFGGSVYAAGETMEVKGTPWKLMKIAGKDYKAPAGSAPAFIKLLPQQQKVVGNTGCNNFGGTYTQQGDKLSFKITLSTKKACPQSAGQDTLFLSTLAEANRFKRDGNKLKLFNGEKVIANFDEMPQGQMMGMEAEKK